MSGSAVDIRIEYKMKVRCPYGGVWSICTDNLEKDL